MTSDPHESAASDSTANEDRNEPRIKIGSQRAVTSAAASAAAREDSLLNARSHSAKPRGAKRRGERRGRAV